MSHVRRKPESEMKHDVIRSGNDKDRYREVFERAHEGVILFDEDGRCLEVNQRASEMLGKGKDELQQKHLTDVVSREDSQHFLVTLTKRGKAQIDARIQRKNGRTVHVSLSASVLGEGLFVGILRDVTEERKLDQALKESEERYRLLVEATPYPIAAFVNGRLSFANHAFRQTFPRATSSVSLNDFFGKSNTKLIKEFRSLLAEPGRTPTVREVLLDAEGGERYYEVGVVPVEVAAKTGLQLTFVDITARRNSLRLAEESEKQFRQLIESSSDGVSIVRDEKFIFVNSGFLSMFGYDTPEKIIGKNVSMVLASRDRKLFLERIHRGSTGDDGRTSYEYRGVKSDGTTIDVDVRFNTVQSEGRPATVAYYRDITEKKRANADLHVRVQSLELLREVSFSTFQTTQLADVLNTGLHSCLKAMEFELGAVYRIGKEASQLNIAFSEGLSDNLLAALSVQNTQEGVTGYVAKTMEPLVLYTANYPPHLPYKSLFESEGLLTVAYVPLAAKEGITGLMMMATRRKRELHEHDRLLLSSLSTHIGTATANATAFLRLHESEERYRSAVENLSEIVYHASPAGEFTFISPTVAELVGYSPPEFYRSADLWRTLLHPDDRPRYSQRISNKALGVDSFSIEYRVLPKGKASYRWVRDSVNYQRDQEGNVASLTGLLTDISDRFQLDHALLKSGEMNTNVLESVREGVAVYDTSLVCVDWNPAMEAITGIKRDDVVGKPLVNTPTQIGLDELRPLIKQAFLGNTVSSTDIPLTLSKEIEPRYIWARYSPLVDKQGEIQGVVGIVTDVTSRRRIEHEAKESEQILRNVIDGMGDALMICDLQGKVWEVNREFSRITGYQRSKVLGLDFPYPWLVEEEMAKFVTWIAALREKSELRDFDTTWRRDDGHTLAMSLNTTLLRNALGEPVAMLNIARDISDRKRLALELEKTNSQIELLNRIISKANATIDFADIFDTIAREVLNQISYDQINVGLLSDDGKEVMVYACSSPIGKTIPIGEIVPIENTVSKLSIARKHGIVIGHLAAHDELGAHTSSISEGFESQISIPIFVNERVLGTFNVASVRPDAFNLEELGYLQPIADQIGAMIDRARLFQRVSDDSKYIHNLLNSINSVVYTVDRHHRITEVNKAWRDFATRLNLDKFKDESQLIGTSLWEIVPQPDLQEAFRRVMPQLLDRKLEYHSQEYEVLWNGEQRTYHIALNPMVINEKVTGLVFSHTDITEIKHTEAEIKRRNKELVALNAISTSISKSLHLDEVLRVASEQIKEIIGADIVLFYLRDERRDQLVLSRSLGLTDHFESMIAVIPSTTSFSGTAISQRKPLLIEKGSATDERVTPGGREVFTAMRIDSVAAIPLQSKDRVLGAMDVAFVGAHEFDVKEQQLLVLIANQIGPVIENAVLYREVQDQVQRITSLYMIGKGLTGALDAQTLLEVVYAEVSRAIPVDRFCYAAYSEPLASLTTIFEVADGQHRYHRSPIDSATSIPVTGSVYANTVHRGDSWVGQHETSGGSVMIVPVKSQQKVIGILSLSHSSPDAYSETHLRLLESIANLTEIALDKAMLYEDTMKKSAEIQERNKELDDFTYVVSHDLKEPLISIEGYSKILLKDYKDRVDDEGKEYLGSVVQSTARMKSLIDDLLTLSRVGRTAEGTQLVSVQEIITEIVHDLQFTLRERNIQVIIAPGLPRVQYNPTQLSMIFRNLISNAMKFNNKPNPTIKIGLQEEADEFVFSVADNGIGIEKQYFDRIFMIFQRLQRSEEFRGTGAGLTIVKKIVENHGGRIWLDSQLGEGTTFYFTIPKTQLIPELS